MTSARPPASTRSTSSSTPISTCRRCRRRACYRSPECASDYTLYVEGPGGEWRKAVVVEGNYQRRRVHRFEAVTSRRIRLEILRSNGDPSARLYQMRVYHED